MVQNTMSKLPYALFIGLLRHPLFLRSVFLFRPVLAGLERTIMQRISSTNQHPISMGHHVEHIPGR